MNVEETCDMCYEYKRCSGEKCTTHVLHDGSILDFARAMNDGRLWGDIVYEEEKNIREKETNSQREKRLKKEGDHERKSMDNLKTAVLNKNRIKNCIKVNNSYILKYKYKTACENLKLEDTVLKDGSVYKGGCWAHVENVCPFLHPDEKDKYNFKGKTKIVLTENKQNTTSTRKLRGGRKKYNYTFK